MCTCGSDYYENIEHVEHQLFFFCVGGLTGPMAAAGSLLRSVIKPPRSFCRFVRFLVLVLDSEKQQFVSTRVLITGEPEITRK